MSLTQTAPTIFLAHTPGTPADNLLQGQRGVKVMPAGKCPAILVSFVYLKDFMVHRSKYIFRDWVLDSGAFSAHTMGTKINLQEYIETCQRLLKEDPQLSEVFALDVIGDWQASLKNTEAMWKAGVPAIPCYHRGEPWDVLTEISKTYPKIALGGVARLRGTVKTTWAGQCFARVWPKRIHGFGYGSASQIMAYPWHSVDATNWEIGPCKYGRWASYGNLSVRGSAQDLRVEVEFYLDLEERARLKWKKQMQLLKTTGPSVRLAEESGARPKAKELALGRVYA